MRLTRRAFLGGLAATASALALDPQITSASVRGRALPLAPRGSAPRIAIIGAGIAGLSAALALRDRGVSSVVYEAQSRVGGRMHSERAFWGNGQVSEYGGELIDTAHTTIRALAKRFDLPLADVLAGVPMACEETIFEAGSYYTQHDLYADFRAFYPVISGHVRDAGYATTFAHSTPTGRALDAMSLATYIERFVPGGSKSRLGQYVLLQYTSEYGIDAHRQSALNMVYWLGRQNAYDPKTGEFVTLGPSDERYHIVGGNDRLPHAIANALPPETVRTGYRLEAIARRPDGRISLSFATPTGGACAIVDAAIVTVPFAVLRNLDLSEAHFDARKLRAIRELGYGDHSKLIVQFDTRFWRERGAWPGRSSGDLTYDGSFVQTWEATRSQPGATGMLVDFASASGSATLGPRSPYTTSATPSTADAARAFVADLERPYPGAQKHFTGKATLSHLTSDPFARGSYSGWLAGQYTAFCGYERVRQGNVHFAGEHCSVPYQGFMEGAAREGMRAAHEVLADIGIALSA